MLYVGCCACRLTVPLWCTGQVLPHAPLCIETSAGALSCRICGLLPPYFTCPSCETRQRCYLPGTTHMRHHPDRRSAVTLTPIFQASAGLGQQELNERFASAARVCVQECGMDAATTLAQWLE